MTHMMTHFNDPFPIRHVFSWLNWHDIKRSSFTRIYFTPTRTQIGLPKIGLGSEKFWSKRILFYNCKELWSKHFQFSIPSDSDFVCITSSGPELLVTRSHSSSLKVIRDHPEVIKGQKSDSNPSAAFETRLNQITIVSKMIQFP